MIYSLAASITQATHSNLCQQISMQQNIAASFVLRLRMWNLVNEALIIMEKDYENIERGNFLLRKKKNFRKLRKYKGQIDICTKSCSLNIDNYYLHYIAIYNIYITWIDNHTVPDLKVTPPGYNILRCNRNKNGGGVACCIRKNLSNIMELIIKDSSHLNLKDNKIYLFGEFNINLLQNGNYILNGKVMPACQGPVHALKNKHQEFCQIFSLKQLITCPRRVTCNTFSLIDYIFTNFTEKIFQSGINDYGMSDHQLFFYIRKVKRAKFNKHNNVFLCF